MSLKQKTAWLHEPRFSLLFGLAAILLLSLGFGWIRYNIERKVNFVKDSLYSSPLPDVILAMRGESLGDRAYLKRYDFSDDWFTSNIPVWQKALQPFREKAGVQYLEIGVYEGRSVIWMLENILTNQTARITAIDTFEDSPKERFLANIALSGSADRVTTLTGYSQVILRTLPLASYDVIYVDGSHAEMDVLEDAVLSWRLLKSGGLMIFDDYRRLENDPNGKSLISPKPAIDAFVQCFRTHCEVIHNEYQLIIRKL